MFEMDKCREEFEVIARSNGWNLTTYPEITERIDYVNNLTEQAWQMYQHQQAKVEELEKDLEAQREETIKGYIKISDLRLERDELQTLYGQQGINMLKLQKQIDALEKSYFVLARIKSIASKNLLESILIKEVRQALKGEGTPKKIPDIYGRCDFKPEPLKTSEDEE